MYTITGAYFSPTGGTKRALELICGLFQTEAEFLDLTGPSRVKKEFSPTDLLVLALPVYAGQRPAVPGLLDGLEGTGTPCILIATYGNRHYDDTLAQMKREMQAHGFRCLAAAAVVTPHIFAPTLGKGRPDTEDMDALAAFVQAAQEKLARPGWMQPEVPGNPCPAPKPAVPVKKDRDWDICLGCGFCAKSCPTGAMDIKTLLWSDSLCISCMSCVAHCPVGALGYNSSALASRLTELYSARRRIETFL